MAKSARTTILEQPFLGDEEWSLNDPGKGLHGYCDLHCMALCRRHFAQSWLLSQPVEIFLKTEKENRKEKDSLYYVSPIVS